MLFTSRATNFGAGNQPGEVRLYRRELGPWDDLNGALEGAQPFQLVVAGSLEVGDVDALKIVGVPAAAVGLLLLAQQSIPVPFLGGVLQANPAVLSVPVVFSPAGELVVTFQIPSGVPSGQALFIQAVIGDPSGPLGVTLTNCVAGVTP